MSSAAAAPAVHRTLNLRSVGVTVSLAVIVALALNPHFITPLPLLLGRTLFVAMTSLLAFAAAARWRVRWLPRWVMQALAVAVTAPVATLAVYMLTVGGDWRSFLQHEGLVSGYLLIAGSGMAVGLVLALAALYRERDAEARAQALAFDLEKSVLERQALDARLATLQAQIEPHFLFNTLANVQALVESGSPRAAPLLQSLIAYLRSALPPRGGAPETLAQELVRVRPYLALMCMRMPDRLDVRYDVDDAAGALPFPPMALLTLVENAVRHGIDPSEQGGTIEVGARGDGAGGARVWVADSGVGLDETAPPGTGLANLRERLQAYYGGRARLELAEHPPHGVRALVVVEPESPR